MHQKGIVTALILVMVLYNLVFPRVSGKELVLKPDSFINFQEQAESPGTAGVDSPLRAWSNGTTLGYFDQNYKPRIYFPAGNTVFVDNWLVTANQNELSLYSPRGNKRASWPPDSKVMAFPNALYLYDRTIGKLTRVDPEQGTPIWTRDFLETLTVLDSRGDRTLVGTLGGSILLVDMTGTLLFEYAPGGSSIEGIYGAALSPDGRSIAIVSGLEPQRFILLEERKNGFRPLLHFDTRTDFRRKIPVEFMGSTARVLYESDDSVVSVQLDTQTTRTLVSGGRPLDWTEDNETGLLFIVFNKNNDKFLSIVTARDQVLYERPLPQGTGMIHMTGNVLELSGTDGVALIRVAAE